MTYFNYAYSLLNRFIDIMIKVKFIFTANNKKK